MLSPRWLDHLLIVVALAITSHAHPVYGAVDCEALISDSIRPDFSWKSDRADSPALLLAQCLLHSAPEDSMCVFYTREAKTDAIRYAQKHNRTTIYDVYPPKYFNISAYPASEWNRTGHLRDLFRVTSKAYAMSCSGTATLVIPEDVIPCPTSIWITDEYDAIKNKLTKIVLPIWKVSWAERTRSWIEGQLEMVMDGVPWPSKVKERDIAKRYSWWQFGRANLLQSILISEEEVRAKTEAVKQQWSFLDELSDPWAVVEGACLR
jgi:hypothetical protein